MGMVLIFCVECGSKSRSDIAYINKTIAHYFVNSKHVVIHFVCMDGKSKYQDAKVLREINKYRVRAVKQNAKFKVIYCFDTDKFELEKSQYRDNEKLVEYCRKNGYHSIWFCHDIEEVYLGKSVNAKEKVQKARKFGREDEIEKIDRLRLSDKGYGNNLKTGKSNIVDVLSQFLILKEEYRS